MAIGGMPRSRCHGASPADFNATSPQYTWIISCCGKSRKGISDMPTLRRAILAVLPARARRTATLISLSALGALVASTAQARLLVSDESNHQVSLYNAGTGAFVDPFIPTGSGGLQDPNGLAFGPDGNFYVIDSTGILCYNGSTGAFRDTFVPAGTGGLDHPSGLAF